MTETRNTDLELEDDTELDVRWRQRFTSFDKAFARLTEAVQIIRAEPEHFLLQAGLIQTFEYTFELAWKTLKDYLEAEGFLLSSPKSTIRQGYKSGCLQECRPWLRLLDARNKMSHTYYEDIAQETVREIQGKFYELITQLHTWLREKFRPASTMRPSVN